MHATSLGSAIFPDDWHWDLKVARREPIAHYSCAGGKAFIRVGPPANGSAQVSTKIRSKPCQSARFLCGSAASLSRGAGHCRGACDTGKKALDVRG